MYVCTGNGVLLPSFINIEMNKCPVYYNTSSQSKFIKKLWKSN